MRAWSQRFLPETPDVRLDIGKRAEDFRPRSENCEKPVSFIQYVRRCMVPQQRSLLELGASERKRRFPARSLIGDFTFRRRCR